jgi:chemotaxis response regulator CheB
MSTDGSAQLQTTPAGRSGAGPVRVLLIDDSTVFLSAATAVVEHASGFELVGVATSEEAGLAAVQSLQPDLVFVDLRMPGIGGLETARQILGARSRTAVVLMTADRPWTGSGGHDLTSIDKRTFSQSTLSELWRRLAPG